MGTCMATDANKSIKATGPRPQKAVIKDTGAQVVTEAVGPRVAANAPDLGSADKLRVKIHPLHELELNDNIEEPWICMGDREADGCQNENPQFQPGMGSRFSCHQCVFYLCEKCATHYKA